MYICHAAERSRHLIIIWDVLLFYIFQEMIIYKYVKN